MKIKIEFNLNDFFNWQLNYFVQERFTKKHI